MRGAADLSPAVRRWTAILLLIVGVQVWLVFARGFWSRNFHWLIVAAALFLAAIPWFNHRFVRIVDSLRFPTPRTRWIIAVGLALLAGGYLVLTAHLQQRDLTPIFSDDYSYLLQMRLLASGRLWMPAHPLADFFEAVHVLVEPVYASIYFPGAAMLYLPAIWLDLPIWLLPCAVSAAVVGLTYRVLAEAGDGLAAIFAALMLAALPWYRGVAMMVGSRIPLMLFGLLAIWAWMHWRRSSRWGWAALIGAMLGWAAVTRPLDALCFAIPIGIAMLVQGARRESLASIVLAALPFLAIQIILNLGVTGKWHTTPFTFYAQRDYPGTSYGFHPFDPSARPDSALPQKQRSYDVWVRPLLQQHQPQRLIDTWMNDRLPKIAQVILPHPLLWILVPTGLLGLFTLKRWVIFATAPLFVLGYAFYAFFLQPYALMIAPAAGMCVMLGVDTLAAAFPRSRSFIVTFLLLAIAGLTLAELPELNRFTRDQQWENPFREVDRQLAALPSPSIVLFDGSNPSGPNLMATYNVDHIWPDEARIVRANDLGSRNVELFRYYAMRSPRREVYRYDLASHELVRLGWADELAEMRSLKP